jgi:dihydrofolate reductase
MTQRPRHLSIIAAVARNRVIGAGNRLPWHLPDDLRHFKRLTLHHPIIMGRRTWESLPGLLPDRRHIVVTRNAGYRAPGIEVAGSLQAALALCADAEQAFVVGGAELYRSALPHADRMHLTLVDAEPAGDVLFPEFDRTGWREVASQDHPADDRHRYAFRLVTLERVA